MGQPPLLTDGFFLPAKHVLHVTGPAIQGPLTKKDMLSLSRAYADTLSAAVEANLSSVALCCLSTGVFAFPADKAASIALQTTRQFIEDHPNALKTVIFCVFRDSDHELYLERFPAVFPLASNISVAKRSLLAASKVLVVGKWAVPSLSHE